MKYQSHRFIRSNYSAWQSSKKYETKEQYFVLFEAHSIIMNPYKLILEYFLFHPFCKQRVSNHYHFYLFLYFYCYNPIRIAYGLFEIWCNQWLTTCCWHLLCHLWRQILQKTGYLLGLGLETSDSRTSRQFHSGFLCGQPFKEFDL